MPLPSDFDDRVYGGCLGKTVGVYLGRPFEGWFRDRIEKELGEVTHYVHERLGHPLVVADDDLSGTFRFVESPGHSAREIGEHWRNVLLEDRTVLWWGGLGRSTEHTAYLRLKNGIEAPASGSIAINGRTVAEQIGAQIFIDGWGMLHPNDPEKAAALAEEAARVSHDGVAVEAARAIAATVAAAFDPALSLDEVLDRGFATIPSGSLPRVLLDRLRAVRAEHPDDWRAGMRLLEAEYGYDRYGGGCHMVPNHGVVLLALLWSNDFFDYAMTIGATAGWDTDCNLGNIGAILGVRHGEAGIAARWRVFDDQLLLPTADPGRCLSDVGTVAADIANRARALHGEPPREDEGFRRSPRGWSAVDEGIARDIRPRNEGGGYMVMGSPIFWPGMTVETDGGPVVVERDRVVVGGSPTYARFVGGPSCVLDVADDVYAWDADRWELLGPERGMVSNRDPRHAFFGLGTWGPLRVALTLRPGPFATFGLIVRASGVRRHTALIFDGDTARLVRRWDGTETLLASVSFETTPDTPVPVELTMIEDEVQAHFGPTLTAPLTEATGFLGLTVDTGLLRWGQIALKP